MHELQAGSEFLFTVFPGPRAVLLPSKGAFDNNVFGQHCKGVQLIALKQLNGGFQALFCASAKNCPMQPPSTKTLSTCSRFGLQRTACKATSRSISPAVVIVSEALER